MMAGKTDKGAHAWTAEEIEARLGTSTALFPIDKRLEARHIAAIRESGITRLEVFAADRAHFDYRDPAHISEILSECHAQGVSIVSMHSPGLHYGSGNEEVRTSAVREGVAAARVAEEMGAGLMVYHFGTDEQSEKTVTEILEQLDGSAMRIANENGQDLRDYVALVDKIGSDRFGMIVDVGHTRDADDVNPFVKKDRARETMAQCGKRLFHVHLHDFIERDHVAPLDVDGRIEWGEIFAAFDDIDYPGYFMFEGMWPSGPRVSSPDHVLNMTAAFPKTFVQRYSGV